MQTDACAYISLFPLAYITHKKSFQADMHAVTGNSHGKLHISALSETAYIQSCTKMQADMHLVLLVLFLKMDEVTFASVTL